MGWSHLKLEPESDLLTCSLKSHCKVITSRYPRDFTLGLDPLEGSWSCWLGWLCSFSCLYPARVLSLTILKDDCLWPKDKILFCDFEVMSFSTGEKNSILQLPLGNIWIILVKALIGTNALLEGQRWKKDCSLTVNLAKWFRMENMQYCFIPVPSQSHQQIPQHIPISFSSGC